MLNPHDWFLKIFLKNMANSLWNILFSLMNFSFKKLFAILVIFLFSSKDIFASPLLSSILANPEDNLKNEFIEIVNTGCSPISLAEYFLTVGTKKILLPNTSLDSHARIKFTRGDMGFVLKDSGDTVTLSDNSGNKIDEITYSDIDAKKWNILTLNPVLEECNIATPPDSSPTESGTIITPPTDSGSIMTPPSVDDPEEFLPENMELEDTDSDGSLDAMKIFFPEILTWTLDTTNFSFANFSWGIIEQIDSPKILSGMIIDNSLVFSLTGAFSSGSLYSAEQGSQSGIFLHSEGISLESISGQKIPNFDEKSFENYSNITIIFSENPENLPPETSPETNSPISTGATNSGTAVNPKVIFPTIIPTFQRSTTASLSGNTLFCDTNPCKINLTFDPIFESSTQAKQFLCETIINGETYATCNPTQFTFDKNSEIIFKLTDIASKQEIFSTFLVDLSQIPVEISTPTLPISSPVITKNPSATSPKIPEKTLPNSSSAPVIILWTDGDFEQIFEWKSDHEIVCLKEICAVNLNANDTYSREGMTLKYHWNFANGTESTRKNPGAVTFETGNYEIILTVTDANGMSAQKNISVIVPKKIEKTLEKSEEKTKTGSLSTNERNSSENASNLEFIPPEIILQNPANFDTTDKNNLICHTNTTSCSANFSLSESNKNYVYAWIWDEDEAIESMNPKSRSLEVWKHTLTLRIFSRANPSEKIFEKSIQITVIKNAKITKSTSKKVAAAKKTTVKKTPATKKSTPKKSPSKFDNEDTSLPVETVETDKDTNHQIPFSLAGMLLSGALFTRLRKKDE